MVQVMNSSHLTVIGLENDERSALASLLYSLDTIVNDKAMLIPPNHVSDLYSIRKAVFGY